MYETFEQLVAFLLFPRVVLLLAFQHFLCFFFIQVSNFYSGLLRSDRQYFSFCFPPWRLERKVKGNKSTLKGQRLWWPRHSCRRYCIEMLILQWTCTLLTSRWRIWDDTEKLKRFGDPTVYEIQACLDHLNRASGWTTFQLMFWQEKSLSPPSIKHTYLSILHKETHMHSAEKIVRIEFYCSN